MQNAKSKTAAMIARKPVTTGTGRSMYRPSAPEVLINKTAMFSSKRFLR